jgi:hypothetical protein
MRNFTICILVRWNGHIKDDEIGRACNMGEKCIRTFGGKSVEKGRLERPGCKLENNIVT